jgi:hypothetical protein
MHAVAVAITLVVGSLPDVPGMRWARSSALPPNPVVPAPNVIAVRPHPSWMRRDPDRSKTGRRGRSDIHARIERDMRAGRQNQGPREGNRRRRRSKLAHKILLRSGSFSYQKGFAAFWMRRRQPQLPFREIGAVRRAKRAQHHPQKSRLVIRPHSTRFAHLNRVNLFQPSSDSTNCRTPAEPAPPPIREPDPPENPDVPIREPEPDEPGEI